MTVFPYATQQAGWSDFATQLDAELDALNPDVLLSGQSGGLISEHIDSLYTLQKGVTGLADSAHDLAATCGVQDGYDHELASAVSREEVADAEVTAKKAGAMMRAGVCDPAVAELLIARADALARERQEAVEKHAAQTSGTHFEEPESIEIPEVGEGGEPGKKDGDPGTKKPGGIERGEDGAGGESADTGEEKGEKPEEPSDGVHPLPEIVSPEPSGPTDIAPAPRVFPPDGSVELRPERVQSETTLSRGDAPLVAPSSSMLGQQTPQVPTQQAWQPPQYTGVSSPSRMLGNMNPNNQQQRKDRQEPAWDRPVPAETLAAIPVAHHVTSPTSTAPNVPPMTPGSPGTHTSAASVPTSPTSPSGQTPGGVGPTPVSTVGPGARTAVTSGGMREKPVVPETLRAVLDEQTVRDLEASLSEKFPEPTPNSDPIPTGAIR